MIDTQAKPQYILTIDIGNTRVKWALFKACDAAFLTAFSAKNLTVFDRHMRLNQMLVTQDSYQHAANNADMNNLEFNIVLPEAASLDVTQVIIANVASEAVLSRVLAQFKSLKNLHIFTSEAHACGVQNHYENPQQLGVDRWAAVIAAWQINQADCVVVNAGTAVTIDVVEEATHILTEKLNGFSQTHAADFRGGLILPGLALMQEALHQRTANLREKSTASQPSESNDFVAQDTQNAIQLGAVTAVCSSVKYVTTAFYQTHQRYPTIIISGGDAQLIKNAINLDGIEGMTNDAIIVDNLVLLGLYLRHALLSAR